jgi:hypothetical protein
MEHTPFLNIPLYLVPSIVLKHWTTYQTNKVLTQHARTLLVKWGFLPKGQRGRKKANISDEERLRKHQEQARRSMRKFRERENRLIKKLSIMYQNTEIQ